jgi:hypothetical protein
VCTLAFALDSPSSTRVALAAASAVGEAWLPLPAAPPPAGENLAWVCPPGPGPAELWAPPCCGEVLSAASRPDAPRPGAPELLLFMPGDPGEGEVVRPSAAAAAAAARAAARPDPASQAQRHHHKRPWAFTSPACRTRLMLR